MTELRSGSMVGRVSSAQWFRDRIRSIGHAARGMRILVSTQPNARIHLVATVVVVALAIAVGLSAGEWVAIILVIALVWTAEGFNTALESLCDLVSSEHDPLIGRAKDIAAAAVLISSIGAAVVGLIVFVPKLWPGLFK